MLTSEMATIKMINKKDLISELFISTTLYWKINIYWRVLYDSTTFKNELVCKFNCVIYKLRAINNIQLILYFLHFLLDLEGK
jgi:hypothetical protein